MHKLLFVLVFITVVIAQQSCNLKTKTFCVINGRNFHIVLNRSKHLDLHACMSNPSSIPRWCTPFDMFTVGNSSHFSLFAPV